MVATPEQGRGCARALALFIGYVILVPAFWLLSKLEERSERHS